MSFFAGFVGGLADGLSQTYDQNVALKEKKRERAFQMMQQGIERYRSDQQKRGRYQKTAEALYQHFPDVDKRAIHSAINLHDGDPIKSLNYIRDQRLQYVEPQSQEQQMAALGGGQAQPGTDTTPQVLHGSMGVSGAPTSGMEPQMGMLGGDEEVSFFGRMMGKQPDSEIFDEVAQELGMDGESFRQYMSSAGMDYELPTGDGYIVANPSKLDMNKVRQQLATKIIDGATFSDQDPSQALEQLNNASDAEIMELANTMQQHESGILSGYIQKLRQEGREEEANALERAAAERQAHGSSSLQRQLLEKVSNGEQLTPGEQQALMYELNPQFAMFTMMSQLSSGGSAELPERAGIESEDEPSRSSGMQQPGPEGHREANSPTDAPVLSASDQAAYDALEEGAPYYVLEDGEYVMYRKGQ